jgi:putative ABC transport system substrate-binding protein
MAGKWVELLKKTAPYLTQVALLFNPETAPGGGSVFLDPVEKAAPAFGLNWLAAPARHADEIETIVGALGRHGATGLLVAPDIFTTAYREKIITLTQRYRLPSMYAYRYFAADGGLMSYGMDPVDQCRQAAGYINRILKGAAAGELPIQAPTRFELVINLRTARTLGLEVPQTILAFADAVIE